MNADHPPSLILDLLFVIEHFVDAVGIDLATTSYQLGRARSNNSDCHSSSLTSGRCQLPELTDQQNQTQQVSEDDSFLLLQVVCW